MKGGRLYYLSQPKFRLNPIVQMHISHSPSGFLAQILIPFPFSIAFMVMESHFPAKYRQFLSPVLISSTFFYQFTNLAKNLQGKNLNEMIFKCYKSEPAFEIYSTFPITSFIKCKYGTEPPGLCFTLLFLYDIRICSRIFIIKDLKGNKIEVANFTK